MSWGLCHPSQPFRRSWCFKFRVQVVKIGVPALAQQDQWHLGDTGLQVLSLTLDTGLRNWHCQNFGLGADCGLDLIPGPGTPCAMGRPKKKKGKVCLFGALEGFGDSVFPFVPNSIDQYPFKSQACSS